jgi:alkyl sulfatase BDS1-like metallo-beta-lactamase superfamily hydrolase
MSERKDATAATRAAQARAAASLAADDGADLARAQRGFIGTIPDAAVGGSWTMAPYGFLDGPAPDSANPSLWRQARLNALHGLFEVTPGIYQVRGFDLSNITFIEGERGFIVIDPLISAEPAAAALALMRAHRGEKPVTGVIYTHSHVDHYGGVRGVIDDADIAAGLEIVAPEGFLKAAVSENVLVGNAMGRRATYMYGSLLPRDAKGHIDCGLGKAVSLGSVSLVPPTRSICATGERLVMDGVEIVFQVTPDTEARRRR